MTVPTPSPAAQAAPRAGLDDGRWTGPVITESEPERVTIPDVDELAAGSLRSGSLRSGTILDGRYEIGEVLGQGGMGYVVAARHVVLGKRVAIKVLRPELTADAEMAERFRIEARAASSIGHPNIVDVSDFGELPEGPARASYFVMEHLEGESLATRIERQGALQIGAAADIVRQMASGLHAAHVAGIVHRDVKPENVILTTRAGRLDHVKLLDFGIAKLESSRRDTGRSLVLGTPAYMAPEQARGHALDARADVYSLGVVLFELLAGRLPFDDGHPLLVVRRHATEPVPAIRELRDEIPLPLAELVTQMLAKRPEQRPSSMEEVVERLAPFASATHVTVSRPSPMPLVIPATSSGAPGRGPGFSKPAVPQPALATRSERPHRRGLRVEWIAAVGLVLVGVIVGALGVRFLSQRSVSAETARFSRPAPAAAPVNAELPVVAPVVPPQAPSAPAAGRASALGPGSTPAQRPASARSPAVPSEEPAAPNAPNAPNVPSAPEAPPRPPTFGEQNLLDPWE